VALPKNTPALAARRQALERYAARQAAQAERDRANLADLTAYFLLSQQIADHATAVETLRRDQTRHLRSLSERGLSIDDIAADTGLRPADLRRMLKSA
jgi:hypothetical protein